MESQMGYFSDGNEKEKDEEYFFVYIRYSTPILSSDQTTNNNKPEAVVVSQALTASVSFDRLAKIVSGTL
jgi:hypothetical protein